MLQLLKDARREAASVSHDEMPCQESLTIAASSSFEEDNRDGVPDNVMIQSKVSLRTQMCRACHFHTSELNGQSKINHREQTEFLLANQRSH